MMCVLQTAVVHGDRSSYHNLSCTINRIDGTGISSDMEQALLELHGSREGLEVLLETHTSMKKWGKKKKLEVFL